MGQCNMHAATSISQVNLQTKDNAADDDITEVSASLACSLFVQAFATF